MTTVASLNTVVGADTPKLVRDQLHGADDGLLAGWRQNQTEVIVTIEEVVVLLCFPLSNKRIDF